MKQKTIMCFGTFDILHLGHLHYLQQAKSLAPYLIVVIACDKTKHNINKPPYFNEKERSLLIQNLTLVDEAIIGDFEDHFKVIKTHQPDIILLGYDHKIKETELKEKLKPFNLFPTIKRAKPYKISKYKSSLIRKSL